jgi:hypothetical protein
VRVCANAGEMAKVAALSAAKIMRGLIVNFIIKYLLG